MHQSSFAQVRTGPNRVEHDYHDHSNDVDEETQLYGLDTAVSNVKEQAFPLRLHYVLAELEKDGLAHVASWQPHGRCFVVHKREEFVRSVLPCWFAQSSIASFQRQCNIYGFKRLTAGPDKGGYYHEKFLKDMEFLAHRIVRTKIKNKGRRKPASSDNEPDFYKMPAVPRNQSDTVVRSASLDNLTLTALLRPVGGVPRWEMTNSRHSQGLNLTEARPMRPFNPVEDAFPDLLAFLNPYITSRARDEQENAAEAEYMRQLLEPITDFDSL